MLAFQEYVERYKKFGRKLGDVIPSDAAVYAMWDVSPQSDLLYDIRTHLRADYQYASNPDGTWTIVFEPRNKRADNIEYKSEKFDVKTHVKKYVKDFGRYLDSCTIDDLHTYKEAKSCAIKFALSMQPILQPYYDAYLNWFKRNMAIKGPRIARKLEMRTEAEEIGHLMVVSTTIKCRETLAQIRKQSSLTKNKPNKSIKHVKAKRVKAQAHNAVTTTFDLYKACCDKYMYVPADDVLELFTGIKAEWFEAYRVDLIAQGYEFYDFNMAGDRIRWHVTLPEVWTEADEAAYREAEAAKIKAETEFKLLADKRKMSK